MHAQDLPFTKLINVDQGAREHFHVPKYQREYTWRKWQWEQLLNDIEDNEPGYFMGSIICVNDAQSIQSGSEIIFEVVDGQQRLTTLSLLLTVIHSKLAAALPTYSPPDDDDREEAASCLTNIRAKLVKRKKDARPDEIGALKVGKNTYFLRVQPSAQNHNCADYLYLLSDAGLIDRQHKPPYCGNRLLGRAYAYFHEKVPSDIPALLSLMAKINQLIFVQITVGSQADAFTLFESLNNRGVPLSAMDIIKNKMLAQMERKHETDIDESFERWQELVESIPDPNDQERFLRQFYNINKNRDEIKVDKATRATKSLIIRIYETLINRDAPLLFDELTSGADIYGKLLRADFPSEKIATCLTELERINSAPAYLVLLYLFTLDVACFEKEDFLENVVDLIVRYFIRRNVTDTPPTRQIDQALIDLVDSCASRVDAGGKLTTQWFTDELMKHARPASLSEFRSALNGDMYENNSWMTRYVLIQLDQESHSKEYRPDFWARDDKGRFIWTVEHVLPQAEKLPDHWVTMIAGGDKTKATAIQEAQVHRLGNLTLSGYNSDLSMSAFKKKQQLSKNRSILGQKINIGYQNGLALNLIQFSTNAGTSHCLADAPCWNAEMIERRTDVLVDAIIRLNLLPGEIV